MDHDCRYVYRRRYLDETAWELVDITVVKHTLREVYWDVPLALNFLHRAGRIRTPAATYEAIPV